MCCVVSCGLSYMYTCSVDHNPSHDTTFIIILLYNTKLAVSVYIVGHACSVLYSSAPWHDAKTEPDCKQHVSLMASLNFYMRKLVPVSFDGKVEFLTSFNV